MSTSVSNLSLLGGFLFTVDGARREVAGRKVKALVCRLAFDDAPLSRDGLAALLWPDSAPAAARHSLRQALSELRRALQGSSIGLTVTPQEAALETYGGRIDVRELRALADSDLPADWQRAMTVSRGQLLEGLDVRVDAFDEWLGQARRELTGTALGLCRRLLEHHEDDAEQAIEWAKRLLTLDPLDEAAHRDLMRLYIVAGQDGAAIRQFLHCRSLLERELGIGPEAATTELYEGLLTHRGPASPAASSPAAAAAGPTAEPDRRLRPAVVLCCELALGADPEQADVLRPQQLEQVSGVVRSYGGRLVAQVGSQVVCGFGLETVRGTEADRACLAAAELSLALPDVRVGIALGQVIYRSEDRTLVGEAATRAQALAGRAAPGEVRLSEAVAAARRLPGRAGPRGTEIRLRVGGQDEPVPLVGRALEVRQFVAVLDGGRDGHGCSLLLRGEAGIGKTRLVQEFVALAGREAFAVHVGQAYDFGTARDEDALAQLVRSLLAGRGDDPAALARRVGEPLVPYLQAVMGIDPAPELAEQLDALSPFERLRRYTEAVLELLGSVARESPQLIVVEDLHWADRLSLAVLPRLCRAAAELPVVVVMTSRVAGEALDPEWRAAMGGAPLVTLDLQPLREPDAGRLASDLGANAPELSELLSRAGGNPLFIQQLVRGARLGPGIPHSIQSLAVAQLEVLPAATQAAVRAASVLGQHFTATALAQTAEGAPDLAPAAEAGLLIRGSDDEWNFHHALIRDGIYHNVLASERRRLHGRAAEFFRERSLSLHAQHLDLAEHPHAVDALLDAAGDEIEHYRLANAITLVRRALEKAPEVPRGRYIDAQLQLMLGNTVRAAEGFRACREQAGDDALRAQALVGLGMALNQLDDYAQAVDALNQAVALNQSDHAYQADAWLQLGNVHFPQGRTEECQRAHETSLEHAIAAASTLRQARAEGGLGDAYYQQGAMLTAHRHFSRCVELGERHRHFGVVPANLAMGSLTLAYQNRFAEALEGAGRALELARRASNARHELLAHNVLAAIEAFHGNIAAGLEHARATDELGARMGSRRFALDAQSQLAHLHWLAGDTERARAMLAQVDGMLDAALVPFGGAYLRGLQAACAATAEERRSRLAEGERMLDARAVSHCYFYFYIAAMEACLAAQEWAEALRYAEGLEAYTAAEPLPLSDLFIRRARVLAADAPSADARAQLLAEARSVGVLVAERLLDG